MTLVRRFMKTCCFIGHRKIKNNDFLELAVTKTVENLIEKHHFVNFIFGSKSEFDTLCQKVVFSLKNVYKNIKMIDFCCGNENPQNFDKIYKPPRASGKFLYIERNKVMIDCSDLVVFYFNENDIPLKSGTKIAYIYALNKNKKIINLYK